MADEGKQDEMYDEPQLLSNVHPNANTRDTSPPLFTSEKLAKMKVKELKAILVDRKIKTSDNKKDLIARLMDSINSPSVPSIGDNEREAPADFLVTFR